MRMQQIRWYEMIARVDDFGSVTHVDLFPADSPGGQMFASIHTAAGQLQAHVVAQAAGRNAASKGATAKDAARDALRKAALKLRRTSRSLAGDTPGLTDKFRLPKSNSDQRLLAVARAILQEGTTLRDQFVAHKMPATFVEDMTATIDTFEAAIHEHTKASEARTVASAQIEATIASTVDILEKLDPVVMNTIEGDAGLVAEWESARHVSRVTIPFPSKDKPTPPGSTTKVA